MHTELQVKIIGKATRLYIGEVLTPVFLYNTGGIVEYEIMETVNKVPYHIKGVLNLDDLTGTLLYRKSTFNFKFSKYGKVTDLGNMK
jgi:hypothetical protein